MVISESCNDPNIYVVTTTNNDSIAIEEETKENEADDPEIHPPTTSNANEEREFPNAFYCKITGKVMSDPVVIPNGDSYERSVMEERGDFPTDMLYSNRALKAIIERTVAMNGTFIRAGMEMIHNSMRQIMGQEDRPLPDEYYCPISCELMHVPVIDPEGSTYERAAVLKWVIANGNSPLTRTVLSLDDLYPNNAIKDLLDREKAKSNESVHPSIRRWKEQAPPEVPDLPTTPENINGTTEDDIVAQTRGRKVLFVLGLFAGFVLFSVTMLSVSMKVLSNPSSVSESDIITATPTNSPTISIQPPASPTVWASPTPECDMFQFQLTLITDNYGHETTWNVRDNNGNEVTSGGPYNSNNRYIESECLVCGLYTFTIYDTANDGLCCNYGFGSYKLDLGGVDFAHGGAFESNDTVSFAVPLQLDPRFPHISSKTPYVIQEQSNLNELRDTPNYLRDKLFNATSDGSVEIKFWDGSWISDIYLPVATGVPSESVVFITTDATWDVRVNYPNGMTTQTLSRGDRVTLVVAEECDCWVSSFVGCP